MGAKGTDDAARAVTTVTLYASRGGGSSSTVARTAHRGVSTSAARKLARKPAGVRGTGYRLRDDVTC